MAAILFANARGVPKMTTLEEHEAWNDLRHGWCEHPQTAWKLDDIESVEKAWCSGIWGDTEQSFAWLVRLKDGRWVAATGSCDYTGWGCQDAFASSVQASREDAIRFGFTLNDRENLGLLLPDDGPPVLP